MVDGGERKYTYAYIIYIHNYMHLIIYLLIAEIK